LERISESIKLFEEKQEDEPTPPETPIVTNESREKLSQISVLFAVIPFPFFPMCRRRGCVLLARVFPLGASMERAISTPKAVPFVSSGRTILLVLFVLVNLSGFVRLGTAGTVVAVALLHYLSRRS
jgi:hypothetical protein